MKASNPSGAGGRERTARRAVAITAATAVASCLAAGPAAAARTSAPPSAAAAVAPAASTTSRTLTLINGDRVAVTATRFGGLAARIARAAGGINGALVRLDLAGRAYETPADALPYLGRGLSPALFELSSLAGAESAGRLPVQVGYHGGLPKLPGVTITSSRDGTARGYLTAASATTFGTALASLLAADHAHGSYGADGMFADGVSIGLPGQAAAAATRPQYVMHTLTVTGTDLAGQPDTGDLVSVFNVDNLLKFGDPVETTNVFYDGSAKFSVPAGHYMAIGRAGNRRGACGWSTRRATQSRCPPPRCPRAGMSRPCSTSRWCRRSARTAGSWSLRPEARASRTWPPRRTPRRGWARR
jgi:hypothetical protein